MIDPRPEGRRKTSRRRFRLPFSSGRGFTLAEVMMSVTIFAMITLGIYQMLIKAYQMSSLTRYRDDARAVILTFADQFMRLQTTAEHGNPLAPPPYTRYLFTVSTVPTGTGLQWGALSDQDNMTYVAPTTALAVTIGGASNSIPAAVTRTVVPLDASTGASSSSTTYSAAGYLLLGTFTITYTIYGQTYNQSITVVRAAP